MTNIEIVTVNQVGDALCMSAAMANAAAVLPEVRMWYSGAYTDLYTGTPWARPDNPGRHVVLPVRYKDFGVSSATGEGGNLCEGLTLSLARHLGVDIPVVHRTPQLSVTDEERAWGEKTASGTVLLNTNRQQRFTVKGYPWWPEVCALLPDVRFMLVGGREDRDIRDDKPYGPNVVDMRGKTTLREFMALGSACAAVVSPSSAVCHIAAMFGKPIVSVIGAAEPYTFTDYDNAEQVSSICTAIPGTRAPRYDRNFGCRHFSAEPHVCEHSCRIGGMDYAGCMVCIPPEAIAGALSRKLGGA